MPYLDNIETTGQAEKGNKSLIHKGFELSGLYSETFEKIEKYKSFAFRSAEVFQLYGRGTAMQDIGEKISACGSTLGFSSGSLVSANFCRQRLCVLCQMRRSLRIYSDFCRISEHLNNSGFVFLHLVLTVPNVTADELPVTLDRLFLSSSRFFKIAEIKRAFKGVARCLEVTYSEKRKDFHPHFHCLIAVNKSYFTSRDYIKIPVLRKMWTAAFEYSAQNDVKRISDKKLYALADNVISPYQCHVTRADEGALAEIAKYCVKPLSLKLKDKELFDVCETLNSSLHGRRLLQLYGVFKDAARTVRAVLDDEPLDETPVLLYDWNYITGHYAPSKYQPQLMGGDDLTIF